MAPSRAARLSSTYLGGYLLVALLIGGGSVKGLPTTFLLEALSLPLIFTVGPRSRARGGRSGAGIVVLLVLILCMFLLQILPFFGAPVGEGIGQLAGIHALTLSADLGRTLDSLAFVFSTCLVFVAVLRRTRDEQNAVLSFVLLGVTINLALAFLQFSASRSLEPGFLGCRMNAGIFANQNHFSSLLYASIPFWVYVFEAARRWWLVALPVAVILFVEFAAGSTAGIVLALASTLASLALVPPKRSRAGLALLLPAVILLGVLVATTDWRSAAELGSPLNRITFAKTTLKAIGAHLPLGTGFGTFPIVYPRFEASKDIYGLFVNHAHNDWLELVLEGGLPAVGGIALYLGLVALRLPRACAGPLPRAAILTIGFVLLHSLVDYPLRTMAMANLFAFANAVYFARFTAMPNSGPSSRNLPRVPVHGSGNRESISEKILTEVTYKTDRRLRSRT